MGAPCHCGWSSRSAPTLLGSSKARRRALSWRTTGLPRSSCRRTARATRRPTFARSSPTPSSAAPYVGQVLDEALAIVQAVIVLFTPDDLARLREGLIREDDPPNERELRGQPRPNVLYEAGLAFGRHPDRTVLVELGPLRG